MYVAFYIQPNRKEKEQRVVICQPYVSKPSIAWAVLRSARRKDATGGILAGDGEHLEAFMKMLEEADGSFPDSSEKIINLITDMVRDAGCKVFFKQDDGEPSFAHAFIASIYRAVFERDKLMASMASLGVIAHINPTEYYDVTESGDTVNVSCSRFAVASNTASLADLRDWTYFFSGEMGLAASQYVSDDVTVAVYQGTSATINTDDRVLISASISLSLKNADNILGNSNKVQAFKNYVHANIFEPRNVARGALKKTTIEGTAYTLTKGLKQFDEICHLLFASSERYYAVLLVPDNDTGVIFGCRKQVSSDKDALKLYAEHLQRSTDEEVDLPSISDVKFYKFPR